MRENGSHNWAYQYLLDPRADTSKDQWKVEWIQRYSKKIESGVNVYLIVDPASERNKRADYTVIIAIGLGADRNYYILDMVRDKLSLKQRAETLIEMHQKFPAMGLPPKECRLREVRQDSDIAYIEEKMAEIPYHFTIVPLGRCDGE